ncbi:MAG: methyl-accepting chemotaxis protein [Bacillota bacterium]
MNIIVVGAGKGGTSIVKSLSEINGLNISAVAEVNENAPGVALAKQLGIKHLKSLDEIASFDVDLIIEATGNKDVTESLSNKYSSKCTIINSKGARLIMAMVEKDIEMLEKLNTQIETIHEVCTNLKKSTAASGSYIATSDKIVQDVNKIAKQTKILGINANIEAARSGEHGKGFTVVANEVQKLADSSESFAHEINQLLKKLSEELIRINDQVNNLNRLSECSE